MGGWTKPTQEPKPKNERRKWLGDAFEARKLGPQIAADKAAADKVAADKAAADKLNILKDVAGASGAKVAPLPEAALIPQGAMQGPMPLNPVTQTMANATPKASGAYAPVSAAPSATKAPLESIGGMPSATAPASMNQSAAAAAAAATQANKTSTGVNQFSVPSLNGVTFGGS